MLMTECAKELFGPLLSSSVSRATASFRQLHGVLASTSQVSQRLLNGCRASCAPWTLSLATCRGLGQTDQHRGLAIDAAPWLCMSFPKGVCQLYICAHARARLAVNIAARWRWNNQGTDEDDTRGDNPGK
jgi:hypothetical protein